MTVNTSMSDFSKNRILPRKVGTPVPDRATPSGTGLQKKCDDPALKCTVAPSCRVSGCRDDRLARQALNHSTAIVAFEHFVFIALNLLLTWTVRPSAPTYIRWSVYCLNINVHYCSASF